MPGIASDGSEDLPNIDSTPRAEVPAPRKDYLEQRLGNAYCELKIITDNIQLLKPHHVRRLIQLNSMIGDILLWQLLDREQQDENASTN